MHLIFHQLTFLLQSQDAGMIDFLRSTGKLYSVIAVLLVILLGIAWYLYRMDKKLTKLENEIKHNE